MVTRGVPAEVPLRVHHEIPQAGVARGHRKGSEAADAGDMPRVGHRDRAGSRETGSRALVVGRAAEMVSEPSDAGDQREDVASVVTGFKAAEEGVLGSTSMGTGVFRGNDGPGERRDGGGVHCQSRCRTPGRRWFQDIGVACIAEARPSGDFSRMPNPPPSGGGGRWPLNFELDRTSHLDDGSTGSGLGLNQRFSQFSG